MSNLNELKPVCTVQDIINKFCYTIGMLPTSYKVSLTYEEQLLCIGKYLEETVIPALNNNAEAVLELQNLYISLKNYVDNYFDNLDVQNEINNKLDEMIKDGSLQEIIISYLQIQGILAFDNVSDMQNSTNLLNGSFVKTYGFYNRNDNGGSFYKIRTKTTNDNIDNITLIELSNSSLVAELIIELNMNAQQFGANTNLTTANNHYIQTALNSCLNITISENYLIDIDVQLKPQNNSRIFLNNSTLTAIPSPNGTTSSNMTCFFNLTNLSNINLSGNNSQLIGERQNHENTTAQHGFGIFIENSQNIEINNLQFNNNTGDGIIIQGNSSNISINNIICSNNHRQGLSLCGGNNISIINSIFQNTNGTTPEAGIDLEPFGNNLLSNILIENCKFLNNNGDGLHAFNEGLTEQSWIDKINILNNYFSNNQKYALNLDNINKGIVNITNNIIFNNINGIRLNLLNNARISNNEISNPSNNFNILNSSFNLITNNNIHDCPTSSGIVIGNNSTFNQIQNNHIFNNGYHGIACFASSSSTLSNYNIISDNAIFNNSQQTPGSFDNINIDNYSPLNTIKNNNFVSSSQSCKYNINITSSNSRCYILNNISNSQTSGNFFTNNSYTLMNINDNILDKGSLFT